MVWYLFLAWLPQSVYLRSITGCRYSAPVLNTIIAILTFEVCLLFVTWHSPLIAPSFHYTMCKFYSWIKIKSIENALRWILEFKVELEQNFHSKGLAGLPKWNMGAEGGGGLLELRQSLFPVGYSFMHMLWSRPYKIQTSKMVFWCDLCIDINSSSIQFTTRWTNLVWG